MIYKNEIKAALLQNLILKSRLLAGIMGFILVMQVVMLSYFKYSGDLDWLASKGYKIFIAPLLLLVGLLIEFVAINYYKRQSNNAKEFKDNIVFFISFVEISFPSILLAFGLLHLAGEGSISHNTILASPPLLVYFIVIILSALTLNARVSVFIGVVAAIEYAIINYNVQSEIHSVIDYRNNFIRSIILVVSGAAAAYVSKRILDAVNSAIESKDTLINQLDKKVEERTLEINLQKEELREKNKEIIDSITYAKRLQDAILPSDAFLKDALSNYFLFYKPKDIVAGDFYWIDKTESKTWLAVCDCTGHGVPGAMVSVVCSNALTQAINQFNAKDPAEALNITRTILKTTFQKSEQEIKDGMDCVLCCFDFKNKKLQFAAANNSLYLLRDGVLSDYKADKMPVGKHSEKQANFTLQEINLQPNDQIFMFTDGYPDQFGGPKGKKYKYKPLEDLLLSSSHKPLEIQQTTIEKSFNEWIGNLEQVDDVCLIGIRV